MILDIDTIKAYDYVDSVINTADDKNKIMWHGWALRDAFIAGVNYQSNKHEEIELPQSRLDILEYI